MARGYEPWAAEFMSSRSSTIGVAEVRAWATQLPAGATVLDIGCGHGDPLTRILVDAGLDVYAIDASPTLLAELARKFPHVRTRCEAIEDSTLFDRRFDAVLAWGIMFLLQTDTQRALIPRVARALQTHGRFLFTAPLQVHTWTDRTSGAESVSLGAAEYRRLAQEAGLDMIREFDDEAGNHYYDCIKL